jgi:hypothetical protein
MGPMSRRMSSAKRRVLLLAVLFQQGNICLLCKAAPVKDPTLDHLNGNSRDDRLENLVMLCRGCNTAEGNRVRRGESRLITRKTLKKYQDGAAETLRILKADADLRATSQARGEFSKPEDPRKPVENMASTAATDSAGNSRAAGAGLKPLPGRVFPDGTGGRVPCVSECVRGEPGVDRRAWGTAEEAANLLMEPTFRLWLFRWVKRNGTISKGDAIDAGAEYLDQMVGRGSQATVLRYFQKVISSHGWLEERRGSSSEPLWGFRTGVALDALEELLESRMRPVAPAIPLLEVS